MLRSILDKLVFGLGLLAGGIFPSYIIQYRQRLGGLVDQVSLDLRPFQEIANRYHDGSIDALIRHHLNSNDPTFKDEGVAIRLMADSYQQLSDTYAALDTSLINQMIYLATNIDEQLFQSTWADFSPAFVTTVDALICAFITAFLFSLILHGILWGTGLLSRTLPWRKQAES